jgi:ring-1,2-phenylacetyl-CoA epoxidase subunit PaaD
MRPQTSEVLQQQVWTVLSGVPDPEIPVISIVDLGIVRDVRWDESRIPARVVVTVTPTYSGCPATEVIAQSIREALDREGFGEAEIETRLAPPWTTDWLSAGGRERLKAYGIAPPVGRTGNEHVVDVSRILRHQRTSPAVCCPRCGSGRTEVISEFGSTPCKALYRCLSCREPFDYFKCH